MHLEVNNYALVNRMEAQIKTIISQFKSDFSV